MSLDTLQVSAPGTRLDGFKGGEVLGCCYVTKRCPNHIMQKTGGSFGVSEAILERLQQGGIIWVLFAYKGIRERSIFVCRLTDLITSKLRYSYHGCDVQRHIRLSDKCLVMVPGSEVKQLASALNKVQHVDSKIIIERVKRAAGGLK